MNEAVIIISTLAIVLSIVSLILACVAVSVVVGLKNSTHTIQWKTLDNPYPNDLNDPLGPEFSEEEMPSINPLSKTKKKVPEDFPFMEDVTENSNF